MKHVEDRAPKAVEEGPVERNEKAAATLPGEPQAPRPEDVPSGHRSAGLGETSECR